MRTHESGSGNRTRTVDVMTRSEDNGVASSEPGAGRSESSGGTAGTSLVGILIEAIMRLLSTRIPEMVGGVKKSLGGILHPQRSDGPAIQERLVETGTRVVAWGRQNPGQAVAAGVALVTVAVVIGVLVHRHESSTERPRSTTTARRTRKKTTSQKRT